MLKPTFGDSPPPSSAPPWSWWRPPCRRVVGPGTWSTSWTKLKSDQGPPPPHSGNARKNAFFSSGTVPYVGNLKWTRPSVKYAKDWLDQLFPTPCLIWSGKEFHLWMWSLECSQQPFFCVIGHFRHGHDRRTNNLPSDPRASLLLTNEKAIFCKIYLQS